MIDSKFINSIKKFDVINLIFGLVAILFSGWYLLPWLIGENLIGVIDAPSNTFQSIYSWMPIIRDVANGNLFPAVPTISPNLESIRFYPYLMLWIYGFIIKFLGYGGVVVIGQWLLPLASFILLTKIFQRYLSFLWAISLSFLGTLSFTEWPFHQFLIRLLQGQGLENLGVYQSLEILNFPFPSFSTFLFLLLFFISTKPGYLSHRRILILTVSWSFLSQVHPADAIFGLVFWVSYLTIRLVRQKENKQHLIAFLTIQCLVITIICFPAICAFIMTGVNKNGFSSFSGFDAYYFFSYFIIPVLLIALIYIIQRVDLFEILFKFWHIYVLLLIEILLVLLASFLNGPNLFIVQNRIALLFLHLYYYVPVIYYAARPSHQYYKGTESKTVSTLLRNLFYQIFGKYSAVYLPVIIVLLILFALISAYKNYSFQKTTAQPQLIVVTAEFETLKAYYGKNDVLVSETPATNLLTTILPKTSYGSLWVNRFANAISQDEVIDRLVLFSRIYNWPLNKFICFMLPGELQKGRGNLVKLNSESIDSMGVGYWLVFNHKILSDSQKKAYIEDLKGRYLNINIQLALKRFHVNKVFAYHSISPDLPINGKFRIGNGYLYQLRS